MVKSLAFCSAFNPDSSETVAYNNPLFPAYVRYGILSTYPDYSAISHWHKDLEFILVKEGTMTYNINGTLIELRKSHGIMVNSRQLHYGFSSQHNECEFICILLSPELLQGNEWFYRNYIEYVTESSSCPYLHLTDINWQSAILHKLEEMYGYFSSSSPAAPSYFKLIEDFAFIMKTLYENLDIKNRTMTKESSDLTSLRNMIAYIEGHFMDHVAIEDIAASGTCCKSKCSLLFKKYLCDTPINYTTKLRLRKSLTALLDSDASITEIAHAYGFGGASYYCETFRKYYGISPLQYRKKGLP